MKVSLNESKSSYVFKQVILNSIEALKGKESPTIILTSREDENFIEIEVNDNGDGINEEIKGKVFNCGFSSKQGHLGIGLHQAFNFMIEMEGGLILKNNEEEKGTTFILRFKKG